MLSGILTGFVGSLYFPCPLGLPAPFLAPPLPNIYSPSSVFRILYTIQKIRSIETFLVVLIYKNDYQY
jgi:hypothetical protein